jgi:hypothetical protein
LITKPRETQVTTLKRKVGYLDEELSVTKAKMSRMDIDTQQQREKASDFIQGRATEQGAK